MPEGNPANPNECDRPMKLRTHVKRQHKGVAKYNCDQCEMVFNSSMHLYFHKIGVHCGISNRGSFWNCDHCGFQVQSIVS